MKKRVIVSLQAAVLLSSCGLANEQKTPDERKGPDHGALETKSVMPPVPPAPVQPPAAEEKSKPTLGNEQGGCRSLVVNDEFCNNLIDVVGLSKSGMSHVVKSPFTATFSTSANIHDPRYIDTTYTVTSGKSWLVLKGLNLANPSASIPSWIEADINDNSIKLFRGVRVGMGKREFLKILGAKYSVCDTIRVDTEEQNYYNYFIFRNNSLRHISLLFPDD